MISTVFEEQNSEPHALVARMTIARRVSTVFATAVMLAGCAMAPGANSGASSMACDDSGFSADDIACMKRRIPLEERFVQMGAMRQEELQDHIRIVRLTDAISQATQAGDEPKAKKLNAELLDVENNLRLLHFQDAQRSYTPEQAAADRLDRQVNSTLPNGRPANQDTSGSGGNDLCLRPIGLGPNGPIMGMVPCN